MNHLPLNQDISTTPSNFILGYFLEFPLLSLYYLSHAGVDSIEIEASAFDPSLPCSLKSLGCSELQQRSIFGQWKTEEDLEDLGSSMTGRELTAHAPLFTNFMTELAVNIDRERTTTHAKKIRAIL